MTSGKTLHIKFKNHSSKQEKWYNWVLAVTNNAHLWLWQISHHGDSVLMTFRHLVQVDKDARVAMVELHTLWKEHRSVAMRVQGEYAIVDGFSLVVFCGSINEPFE